jgi:hypothetical protein
MLKKKKKNAQKKHSKKPKKTPKKTPKKHATFRKFRVPIFREFRFSISGKVQFPIFPKIRPPFSHKFQFPIAAESKFQACFIAKMTVFGRFFRFLIENSVFLTFFAHFGTGISSKKVKI